MDDSDQVLNKAGIHEGGSQPRLKRVRGFVCDICYDEDGQKETLALSCDHRCKLLSPSLCFLHPLRLITVPTLV